MKLDRPGTAVLLQFKLGEELQRFRRSNSSTTVPPLARPFWRFNVDTAEPDGQYDLLLKAEQSDAEVYYVSPRFTNWDQYAAAFQDEHVLEQSLLMRPSEIDCKLAAQGEPDGWHRIVYDMSRVYVCSDPTEVAETNLPNFAESLQNRIRERREPVLTALKRVYESFDRRRYIRVPPQSELQSDVERLVQSARPERLGRSPAQMAAERARRLERLRGITKSDAAALFAAVGIEAWATGSQLLAVTID